MRTLPHFFDADATFIHAYLALEDDYQASLKSRKESQIKDCYNRLSQTWRALDDTDRARLTRYFDFLGGKRT